MAAAARDVATMPLGPRVDAWKRDYTSGPLTKGEDLSPSAALVSKIACHSKRKLQHLHQPLAAQCAVDGEQPDTARSCLSRLHAASTCCSH